MRFGFLCVLLSLAGCTTGVQVANDYDPAADFSRYTQYSWYPVTQQVPPDAYVSELVVERIGRAVDEQLLQKGKQKVAPSTAQFRVRVHLVVEDKLDVQTWNASYGYYHDPWGWGAGTDVTVHQYKQGTLIVDFLDAASGKLFWRGTAESRIRSETSPAEREARIREVVQALLAQYPPGSQPAAQ